uniref:PH domain-containing protein n=2 Tax=Parascaris TaxID=6254 RepID=A0A915BDP9_PARUN
MSIQEVASLDATRAINNEENDEAGDRKTTLKKQKREYRDEKKRVAQELLASLRDPTVVVMADWLKVRGTLRKWNRYYCVLKPGLMMIYKSNKIEKSGHWVGTILLNTCELIERPSKKDGFCFKLFHPLDQSIWATRGPLGESHGAVTLQPLPTTHLICRAPSEQAGGCWMDALQLALRCSGLLMRTMHKLSDAPRKEEEAVQKDSDSTNDIDALEAPQSEPIISETEAEKHFDGLDDDNDNDANVQSESDAATLEIEEGSLYLPSEPEQFGALVDGAQTEDMGDENKSLVWSLLKQVRPGMDLSKVTLPTFILEPRSFLEKLADFYYHVDLLKTAAAEDDPLERMTKVIKFYLSGFYKKPKGLKKPYNPILGEVFRCKWEHPDGSTTFYVAEQVSHHPPISSLFVTNRRAGFNIAGTILAKSKYYGNSLSAMMLGSIRIVLLARGETYTVTLPYANCKGIMIGTLSMEYGGQVKIECNRTAYLCTLDFKLKPFLGGIMNVVSGAIKLGKETLTQISGTWDGEITITHNGKKSLLWAPTKEIIKQRLPRYEIALDSQGDWESKKLWLKVSEAIARDDQVAATEEKSILEEAQRARAKTNPHHKPRYFRFDPLSKNYEYLYADYRPWDNNNDIKQVEFDFIVRTKSKLGTFTRSPGPIGGNVVPRDRSDDSESTIASRRHRRSKKRGLCYENEHLQLLQDTMDRSVNVLQRVEERVELLEESIRKRLVLIFVLITVLQSLVLPFFFKRT